MHPFTVIIATLACLLTPAFAQPIDERPASAGEWGFRPPAASRPARNPPAFAWRPQQSARGYTLQIAPTDAFADITYQAELIEFNVHCPTATVPVGDYSWRFNFTNTDGSFSEWSEPRRFTMTNDATPFPFLSRAEALARIPAEHPRLFLRPEALPDLRDALTADASAQWQALLARCDKILADPPETAEPPKYAADTVRGSDPWRAVWWGNRRHTIALLDSAATLGFTYQITGDPRYGNEARRLLLAAAEWDPKGATGYRYNDEAGMPYAYHFARTYTFIHDLLSPADRDECVRVMGIRGREMYDHLHPRHLWKPYSSHSNRAWHFLGEVAIAFHDDIPEADDWLWFSLNVFANAYPVWSDADGGWHEGLNYWSSYIARFTWWADIMREAVGVDAFDLPYFSRAGDYAMYMMPPGTRGGGFGDLNARVTTERLRPLMTTLAAQSGNPNWRWYIDRLGGPVYPTDYPSLLRSLRPVAVAKAPTDLPTSRLFAGTGQAVLNSTLLGAEDNVRVLFKSSPFGTQSHGYESQNAFTLTAFNEPLLIRSGHRDSYGSDHHKNWMWQTESVNSVLVDGKGQVPHSARAVGEIEEFFTSEHIDYVRGRGDGAYGGLLDGFSREIVFIKPDIIVIRDTLASPEPARFDWLLHAPEAFEIDGDTVGVVSGGGGCVVRFVTPTHLTITQTDRFSPPPRERIDLTQHHLTARTVEPARTAQFITIIRPYRVGDGRPDLGTDMRGIVGGVTFPHAAGRAVVMFSDGVLRARVESVGGEIVAEWSPTGPGGLAD